MARQNLERIVLALVGLALFCAGLAWIAPRRATGETPGTIARPAAIPDAEAARKLAARSHEAYQAGRYQEALAPTLALHEAQPTNHVYLGRLARIYAELDRPADEARAWEEYLVVAPVPSEACPDIGKAYWKRGALAKSLDAYARCLALDPGNPDAIFFMAWAYEHTGDTARAGALYEKGHAATPGYDDMTLGLARIHLRQGKVEVARKAAAMILARAPENADALLVMGLALARQNQRDAARKFLEHGAARFDRYLDFHLALGRMAETDGKLEEARRRYEHVLALDPKNPEALEARERIARRVG